MSRMKRAISMIALICMILCLNSVTAHAESYTDPDTGMSFTVPVNWVKQPENPEHKRLDAIFYAITDEDVLISFSAEDVYAKTIEKSAIPGLVKLIMPRHKMDNSIVTKTQIANMTGASESDVSSVDLGGKSYFKATIRKTGLGFDFNSIRKVSATTLIRIENGYAYMFVFTGDSYHPLYSSFKDIVEGASYPDIQKDFSSQMARIAALCIAVAVVVAIVWALIHRRKKREQRVMEIISRGTANTQD